MDTNKVQVKLDALDAALEEKAFHVSVMRLWNGASAAGYPHPTVKTFTFSDAFLSQEHRNENEARRKQSKPPTYSGITHHNAVRLVSGDLAEIPIVPRPEPPCHMKVGVRKVNG
jgi:hypothetical protein